MSNETRLLPAPRKLWVRLLLMILMAAAFQLAASVLMFLAVVQLVVAFTSSTPNVRLQHLGRSLGRYLAQIADFQSFCNEELPFPFSPWPAGNGQINL